MRNYMAGIVLLLLLLVFSSEIKAQSPDEVLRLLKENNGWGNSVSCELKTSQFPYNNNEVVSETQISFIRDNERCQMIGVCNVYNKDRELLEESSHLKYEVMNGKQYLYVYGASKDDMFRATIDTVKYQEYREITLNDPDRGGALWGRIYGNHGSDIYDLLEGSSNLKYSESDIIIRGEKCFELKGSTKFGTVKVFLSPQQGMAPLRWEIEKGPEDYFDSSTLKDIGYKNWKVTYDTLELKKIGSYFVPVKGRLVHEEIDNRNNISTVPYEYEVSNIEIDPDFEEIEAFKFDLPSYVRVHLDTAPGIVYNFHNGKLVPLVDQDLLDVLDEDVIAVKAIVSTSQSTFSERSESPETTTLNEQQIPKQLEEQEESLSIKEGVGRYTVWLVLAIVAIVMLFFAAKRIFKNLLAQKVDS